MLALIIAVLSVAWAGSVSPGPANIWSANT